MVKRGKKDDNNGGGCGSRALEGVKDNKKSVDTGACIGCLSRTALEHLVFGSLSRKETITEDDINSHLPTEKPNTREGPVGDNETAKNLGFFSSMPTVIVLDILMLLNLEIQLNCCISVST